VAYLALGDPLTFIIDGSFQFQSDGKLDTGNVLVRRVEGDLSVYGVTALSDTRGPVEGVIAPRRSRWVREKVEDDRGGAKGEMNLPAEYVMM
jgi:hypothetical protein